MCLCKEDSPKILSKSRRTCKIVGIVAILGKGNKRDYHVQTAVSPKIT